MRWLYNSAPDGNYPMNISNTPPDYEQISETVASHGYAIVPDFVPAADVEQLAEEARGLREAGLMRRAGIGRGAELSLNDSLRGDFIHWLDTDDGSPARRGYLARLETLRQAINRTLYLGLFDFEGHFAIYPPGAFYRKHLDQFQYDSRRTLTCILYLNQNWQEKDGGKLRIYLDENGAGKALDVPPLGGTLVTFLSSRFWHEVLPARRERASITGWFRTRAAW